MYNTIITVGKTLSTEYVCNVLRKPNAKGPNKSETDTEIASEIKFLSLLVSLLAGENKVTKISKAPADFFHRLNAKTSMFVLS